MKARIHAAFALLALAAPLRAQNPDEAALDRVVDYIDAAQFDSARIVLSSWQSTRAASALPSQRAAAATLAARLERDGAAARDAWLSLALEHPFSPDAGLAMLRVGQAAVLTGDTATALVYLTRLHDDFPGSGHTAEAHLWLSRAHALARRGASACASARAGLAAGGSAEVLGLLRVQQDRVCVAGATDPAPLAAERMPPAPERTPPAAQRTPPASEPTPPASEPTPPAPVPVAAGGRYAVQSGAFRGREGADALVARLRAAGLQPRLVRVPGSELMRVRVGAFETSADAIAVRDRLRSSGFDAVVVDDATRESAVP